MRSKFVVAEIWGYKSLILAHSAHPSMSNRHNTWFRDIWGPFFELNRMNMFHILRRFKVMCLPCVFFNLPPRHLDSRLSKIFQNWCCWEHEWSYNLGSMLLLVHKPLHLFTSLPPATTWQIAHEQISMRLVWSFAFWRKDHTENGR